jgi:hypothetical protein
VARHHLLLQLDATIAIDGEREAVIFLGVDDTAAGTTNSSYLEVGT